MDGAGEVFLALPESGANRPGCVSRLAPDLLKEILVPSRNKRAPVRVSNGSTSGGDDPEVKIEPSFIDVTSAVEVGSDPNVFRRLKVDTLPLTF